MNKKKHIDFWITQAEDYWLTVKALVKSARYLHALFFAHLVLEKICKALWIKENSENYPPKIHNLLILLETAKVDLTLEQKNFLAAFNDFQLESRYPDYTRNVYKICTLKYTKNILEKVEDIKTCLLSKLQ